MKHRRYWLLAGLILSAGLAFQIAGAWQDGMTSDEGNHLAAGVVYWQTGNFTWNPAHPPLVKLMAAVPLQIGRMVYVNTAWRAWQIQYLPGLITNLFYDQTGIARPQLLFFLGRLPVLAFWLLLGILLFCWSRSRWGFGATFLTLGVYVFDPNFLGHGHLINTDVPVTAMIFATLWAADRYFRSPKLKPLLLLALLFGLTQVTKFSAVILWPIVLALGVIKIWTSRGEFRWRQWLMMAGALVAVTGGIIWTTYGFEARRLHVSGSSPRRIVRMVSAMAIPYPAASYWRGLYDVIIHNEGGHTSYLNGQTTTNGQWNYFPEALALKTPLLTLVLFAIWMAAGGRTLYGALRRRPWRCPSFDVWVFGLTPVVIFTISVISNLNIGLRHIFPIYPFIFLAIGSLATLSWPMLRRYGAALISGLTVIALIIAWRAWPNTIGYFNVGAGGTNGGHRYLLDSNVDWGQDVWRLRRFLDQQQFPLVRIQLFTSVPTGKIFSESDHLIRDADIAAGVQPSGVIVVSTNILYRNGSKLSWLRSRTPKWRIGSSIYVFDFRS
ncbi:MAG: hypothetical protein AAB619_01195 [Patescibacteria group bacterium]